MASSQRKQQNNTTAKQSILTTLLYSDLFDFPLTKEELWKYLISKKKITREKFESIVAGIRNHALGVREEDGYYCLAGKEAVIQERKKHLNELAKKQTIALKAASYLAYIPTILFIGVSGGVAVGNVKKEDDIDFFIITRKRTLFITRLWVLALLEWLKLRRKREDSAPADKICVNLLIEESALSWPSRRRDIYTAHEIVQITPLFEREQMYEKFLSANKWVEKFLPNALSLNQYISHRWSRDYYSIAFVSFLLTRYPIEAIVRALQKQLINKHRSRETVLNTFLAFHPFDYRTKTLAGLREKTQHLGLLTKD